MEKQAAKTAAAMSGIVEQAFQTLGDSVKVTMKAQEDTLRFWGDIVGKNNPIPNVAADLLPMAQKNTDEYIRLMENSYRRNADLLKKALGNGNGEASTFQNGIEFIGAFMEVANENARELAGANLRIAQSWTEMLKRGAAKASSK